MCIRDSTCACPQMISFSVCCKWFRWAVLPLDRTLEMCIRDRLKDNDEVDTFLQKALAATLNDNLSVEDLIALTMETGKYLSLIHIYGRVCGEGSHELLYKTCKTYRRLYELQQG